MRQYYSNVFHRVLGFSNFQIIFHFNLLPSIINTRRYDLPNYIKVIALRKSMVVNYFVRSNYPIRFYDKNYYVFVFSQITILYSQNALKVITFYEKIICGNSYFQASFLKERMVLHERISLGRK